MVKKILILSCTGGYGHAAAATTIEQLLGSAYECCTFYPINELRILGVPSGESFYNFLLAKNFIHLTNIVAGSIAPSLILSREEKAIEIIRRKIAQEKPDLVISVIPFLNYPASEAARLEELPFLIVTTDNDLSNWVYSLDKCRHPRFKITIGCDLPSTRSLLLKSCIPEEYIETIGLPLRTQFLNVTHKAKLRSQHEIPQDEKVVLLMMGGAGSDLAYRYARLIASLPLNVRLLACTGRNTSLAAHMRNLTVAPGNSLDVIPFTHQIHELMALSDLIITKPGPGTITEAMALKVPLLIDCIGPSLFWEKANIDLVLSYGIGARVTSFADLEMLMKSYLYDSEVREKNSRAFQAIPANQFAARLAPLISELRTYPENKFQSIF